MCARCLQCHAPPSLYTAWFYLYLLSGEMIHDPQYNVGVKGTVMSVCRTFGKADGSNNKV